MGGLNPFKKPKMPKPAVIKAPTAASVSADEAAAIELERLRRANATGAAGNIKSSLAGAIGDVQANTRRSTLLGG